MGPDPRGFEAGIASFAPVPRPCRSVRGSGSMALASEVIRITVAGWRVDGPPPGSTGRVHPNFARQAHCRSHCLSRVVRSVRCSIAHPRQLTCRFASPSGADRTDAIYRRKRLLFQCRASAELWTTNRPDARLARSLTKNIRKRNRSGQPTGEAGRCSQSSVSASIWAIAPAHRSRRVPEIQCQH